MVKLTIWTFDILMGWFSNSVIIIFGYWRPCRYLGVPAGKLRSDQNLLARDRYAFEL